MPQEKALNWGGHRPGAGRNRQRLVLSPEVAKSLWQLTKLERAARSNPDLMQEDLIEQWLAEKWEAVERAYGGIQAKEPFIL